MNEIAQYYRYRYGLYLPFLRNFALSDHWIARIRSEVRKNGCSATEQALSLCFQRVRNEGVALEEAVEQYFTTE